MTRQVVARAADVKPGSSTIVTVKGREIGIFNLGGEYFALANRCPHAGTPLDAWPNEFFTEDGRYLICATHSAVFAPDTGICLGGPCPGSRLEPLSVAHRGGKLVVSLAP